MNNLSDVEIDEISILSANVRPAVRAAKIVVTKSTKESFMNEPISFPTLEAAMDHLRKARGMGGADAMSVAAREHPSLLEKYQREGEQIAKAAADQLARDRPLPDAVVAWNRAVDEEVLSFGGKITRSDAMVRIARERPALYAAMQAA